MSSQPRLTKQPSVRFKILLTVVVSILGFSVLVYVTTTQVLVSSYVSIERASMEQDLSRGVDAIQEFSDQQMIKLADWAAWDEAYRYTLTHDQKWAAMTVYPSSMKNLDTNLSMFTDLTGKISFIMVTDTKNVVEVNHDSIASYFRAHPTLVTHSVGESTKGIVMLPDGPIIIVSLPVLDSAGKGPTYGSLTFGRYLDAEKIADLGKVTHLSLSVYRYDDAGLPEEVAHAKSRLAQGDTYIVEPLSQDTVSGFALLKDLQGNPALILRVDEHRPIYTQGTISLALYLAIGAGALILFGLVILLLLDRLVISRFLRLTSDVEKINDGKDLSRRVVGGVRDEIGVLAEKINQLLTWLSEAREAEAASRRETVNLLDELKNEKEQREEMSKLLKSQKSPEA